jgi:hypothetical protein
MTGAAWEAEAVDGDGLEGAVLDAAVAAVTGAIGDRDGPPAAGCRSGTLPVPVGQPGADRGGGQPQDGAQEVAAAAGSSRVGDGGTPEPWPETRCPVARPTLQRQ